MQKNFKMIAKTFFGLEEILANELKSLGAMQVEQGIRSVSFTGDTGFLYKANLCLRTALKILKPIYHFSARTEKEYYQQIYNFPWEKIFTPNQTFALNATSVSPQFTHTQYLALKAKDAIADRFRSKQGKRPNVDTLHPDVQIQIHVQKNNQITLSLDSSGASLHHRGYRTQTNIAPINEVLAAGILLLSNWQGNTHFLDPMCGSGTFLIEAAMIACNIPANLHRKEFAFEKWNDFNPDLFNIIHQSALKKVKECQFTLTGYDKAPSAVAKSLQNIKNAGLEAYISVKHEDFFKTRKTDEAALHMVFNPPYGERLTLKIEDFYKQIGDTLKQNYPNTNAWLITSNLDALKSIGLRPSRKIKLFNGKLESRLVSYQMYQGTKKLHKIQS